MRILPQFAMAVLGLLVWGAPAGAQTESVADEDGRAITMSAGVQAGVGLSGQFAAGGRFFVLAEQDVFAAGLGVSFLVTDRNVFVPSLNAEAKVSGPTLFTEILGRMNVLEWLQLQAAFGMAVVKREGRVKGFPVEVANQGPYMGADARLLLDPGLGLGSNLALFAGARVVFLEQATIRISGDREIVRLPTQPALVVGISWSF